MFVRSSAAERRRRADHVAAEANRRRFLESQQVGGDDVLEVDPAVQQLVDLDVEVVVGLADVVAVVGLGKEPRGAEDQTRQPVVLPGELTQILGGGLGRAVDVPRNRNDVLGDPGSRLSPGGSESPAERARRAREDEPARPGRDGLLEQVQRAGNVRLDELHAPVRPHVRLVQRRGVHDRVHARHASLHGVAVDDRPDHRRLRRREHVKADDLVALVAQYARQSFAQMSRAAGHENPHVLIHIRPA